MGRLFDDDDDFELKRRENEMEVWNEDGYVFVSIEGQGARTLGAEQAREMAEAMRLSAERHGENNDELYQAAMLERCAEQVETDEE